MFTIAIRYEIDTISIRYDSDEYVVLTQSRGRFVKFKRFGTIGAISRLKHESQGPGHGNAARVKGQGQAQGVREWLETWPEGVQH